MPTVTIGDVTVPEGDLGATTPVQITLTFDEPLTTSQTLTVSTTGGTATDGDFQATSTGVSVSAGQTTVVVTAFTVVGDDVAEPDETFQVTLDNPTRFGTGPVIPGTVTIQDDDSPGAPGSGDSTIQFAAATFSGTEGSPVTIALTRDGDLTAAATVIVTPPQPLRETTAGPIDYNARPTTATFGPGEANAAVAFDLLQDSRVEETESFTLTLANPSGSATLGSMTSATVSILDDDGGAPDTGGPDVGGIGGAGQRALFINSAYQQLLGRPVDTGGMVFWDGVLQSAPSPAVGRVILTTALVTSNEFRTTLIDDVYQDFFNRPADPAGLSSALGFLQAGGSMDQLKAALASSDEYFALAGGTAQGFLQALYQDVLNGGTPERTSLDVTNPLTRFALAYQLLQSPAGDRATVTDYYGSVLNISNPDAAGVNFWANMLIGLDQTNRPRGVLTEDQLLAALATFSVSA